MLTVAVFVTSCVAASTDLLIDTVVDDSGDGGSFISSGGVVEDGAFCGAGEFVNLDIETGSGDAWWFEDEMICSDGTGSLVVRVEGEGPLPKEPQPGSNTGTWTVIRGAGDYQGFEGGGTYDLELTPWSEKYEGKISKG